MEDRALIQIVNARGEVIEEEYLPFTGRREGKYCWVDFDQIPVVYPGDTVRIRIGSLLEGRR